MATDLSLVTKENEATAEEMILSLAKASRGQGQVLMFAGKEAFDFLVCQGAKVATEFRLCHDGVRANDTADLIIAGYRLHAWQHYRKASADEVARFLSSLAAVRP